MNSFYDSTQLCQLLLLLALILIKLLKTAPLRNLRKFKLRIKNL